MNKLKLKDYFISVVIAIIIINGLWFIVSVLLNINALPSPIKVYSSYQEAFNNNIIEHTAASLLRLLIGVGIALLIALVVGVSMGHSNRLNTILSPLIYLSYPIPKLALLPIIMILFGLGDVSKIILIVLIIVFQLMITIRDSVKHIDRENYDVLISLNATRFQKLQHITLPAIIPDILSALRVSIGISMSALFFAETFGTDKGLGYYITDSWMRIDYTQMYFGITVLSSLGILIFLILDLLDRKACKWKMNHE